MTRPRDWKDGVSRNGVIGEQFTPAKKRVCMTLAVSHGSLQLIYAEVSVDGRHWRCAHKTISALGMIVSRALTTHTRSANKRAHVEEVKSRGGLVDEVAEFLLGFVEFRANLKSL